MGAWDGVVLLIPYEPCRRTGASHLDCVLADDGNRRLAVNARHQSMHGLLLRKSRKSTTLKGF